MASASRQGPLRTCSPHKRNRFAFRLRRIVARKLRDEDADWYVSQMVSERVLRSFIPAITHHGRNRSGIASRLDEG